MTSDRIKISVIVPNYNGAETLEKTLLSIVEQDVLALELIVIDGASNDGSVEIIKKFEPHIAYWESVKDKGHYDAVNKGFARSTGDVLGWINSDDVYLPWALRSVSEVFAALPEVQWLGSLRPATLDLEGNCIEIGNMPGFSSDAFWEGHLTPENRVGWYIQQESTFWRRSLWQKVGGEIDTTYSYAGDFDLWARFMQHTPLYGFPGPISGFRYRENQRSAHGDTYKLQARDSFAAARKAVGYKPTFATSVRNYCLRYRLSQMALLGKFLVSNWGYSGHKIVRTSPGSPNAEWKAETVKFL